MCGVDPLTQNLRNVDVRGSRDQRRDHKGDRQYDLGPAAHEISCWLLASECRRSAAVTQRSYLRLKNTYGSATPSASSFSARAPSLPELPYSFSLLCKVFKLIPRISAARVLLLLVDSSVLIISSRSASPTVVPTPTRIESASSAEGRTGA